MGDYEAISTKDALKRDKRVFPTSSTGSMWFGEHATVRYTDKQGRTRAIEGRIDECDAKSGGHVFVFDTSESDDVDADNITIHTNSWDGITAPVSTGTSHTHENTLGYDAQVFCASTWAGMVLDGMTGVDEVDDERDVSHKKEADYERRGEHATRPRANGLQY